MNVYAGSQMRYGVKLGDTERAVLAIFRKGRLYNNNDIRHRLADAGTPLKHKVVQTALKTLVRKGILIANPYGRADKRLSSYEMRF